MVLTHGRTAVFSILVGALSVPAVVTSQPGLEDGKRAYFEGRFEVSIDLLEPLSATLEDPEARRDAAFFLGLSHLALGHDDQGRSYFESAVRHDPGFEPSTDLFNPTLVRTYESVRSGLVGRLLVESVPPGARVRVGARDVGTTPFQGPALAGEQLVRIELEGHAPEERTVTVRAGEDLNLSVTLRPSSAPATTPATQGTTGGGGMSGKTIGILAGAGGGAALVLAAAGGGGDSAPAGRTTGGGQTPQPTNADYVISIQPSVIQSEPSTNPDFDWVVRFEVQIAETNGVGANVDFVNVILRDPTGATTPAVNFGAGEIIARAGTNHIEGGGEIEIPVGVVYNFPGGRSAGVAVVEVQVTDAFGNRRQLMTTALVR